MAEVENVEEPAEAGEPDQDQDDDLDTSDDQPDIKGADDESELLDSPYDDADDVVQDPEATE